MVNVENLKLHVGIGCFGDIVDKATNFEASIIERLGNNVPTADMKITLPYELGPYLETEQAEVRLAFGFSNEEMIYSRWQIVGFTESRGTTTFALTTDRSYLNDTEYKAYEGFSSNVMKSVVEKYYAVEIDGEPTFPKQPSNDRMTWVHHGTSVRDFVDTLWLHSWYGGNRLVIPAITAGVPDGNQEKAGLFKLIDLTDPYKHKNPIKLAADREPEKGLVVVTGNVSYKGFAGKYNNVIGNRVNNQFDVRDASAKCEVIGEGDNKLKPVFEGGFNEKLKDGKKKACVKTVDKPPKIISGNVHENFSKAKAVNLTRLAKFGAYSKRVQVADYDAAEKVYKNIVIGDIVNLTVPYVGMDVANEIHSGNYVVAETVQRITTDGATKTLTKELVLRRDASIVTEYEGLLGVA